MNIIPREVLDLPANFTLETLKKQFKKKVMLTHPDMKSSQIASTEKFQILSTCYKILLNELKMKENEKTFDILKNESQNYCNNANNFVNINMTPDKFNTNKFNKIFEKSKIKDPYEEGYDDWIQDRSNSTSINNKIIKYDEPVGHVSSTLDSYLLGVNKINDFSANNMSDKDLNFMDYKLAYTTPTIEQELEKANINIRSDFRSIDHLKESRANISFQMNDDELKQSLLKKKMLEVQEQERQMNILKRDQIISDNHRKNNGRFLSLLK